MTGLLIIPPLTALLALLCWRRPALQAWSGLAGTVALAMAAVGLLVAVNHGGVQVLHVGGWIAPQGIALVADPLAAALCVVAAVVGIAAVLAARADHDDQAKHPAWQPLVQLLLWGVCGAFTTGDLFNLFVWFEVMLMASFTLLALGGGRERLEGAVKYVAINLVGSALFLSGCGILYGLCGTLNMADLARVIAAAGTGPGIQAALGCLLAAFLLKSAAFPLFAWLPASYHTASPATAALFSALLTKVGVYAVLRLTVTIAPLNGTPLAPVLGVVALATMAVGVLGAATQMELRRILAFHIVSQVGYMLLGIAMGSALALAATAFYLIHHILVKSALFLAVGVAAARGGGEDVRGLGGLRHAPWLYAGFLVGAASLAGIPPLSGFFAKLAVVRAAVEAQAFVALAVALGVGFLTLYSMIKIHREVFAKPGRDGDAAPAPRPGDRWSVGAVLLLAAGTVAIGVLAGPLWAWCLETGAGLVERRPYLDAVLGGAP